MKNLITTIGSLLILMALFMQLVLNQVTFSKISFIDDTVETFRHLVSSKGCVELQDERWFRNCVIDNVGCENEDIFISGTTSARAKGELIHLKIEVKLKNLLAAKRFWGFEDADGEGTYRLERYVISQKGK